MTIGEREEVYGKVRSEEEEAIDRG